MESGRKGREAIRLQPVPLGRDSEENRDYTGRDLPLGVGRWRHTLGAPALGSETGTSSPVGWLEGQWNC